MSRRGCLITMLGVTVGLVIVLVGVCSMAIRAAKRPILWRAPLGARIAAVRTGARPGQVIVLTSAGDRWQLWSVHSTGRARLVVSGRGNTMGTVEPLSACDWHRDRVLVSTRDGAESSVFVCDLQVGSVRRVTSVRGTYPFLAWQPFSPDGSSIALWGRSAEWKPREPARLWCLDTRSLKATAVDGVPPGSPCHSAWLSDNSLLNYDARSGTLSVGRPPNLRPVSKVPCPPHWKINPGSVSPNGDWFVKVNRSPGKPTSVSVVDLPSGHERIAYTYTVDDDALVNWSQDGRHAAISILHPGSDRVAPIMLDQSGRARSCRLPSWHSSIPLLNLMGPSPQGWMVTAGAAFLSDDTLAIVTAGSSQRGSDAIVRASAH